MVWAGNKRNLFLSIRGLSLSLIYLWNSVISSQSKQNLESEYSKDHKTSMYVFVKKVNLAREDKVKISAYSEELCSISSDVCLWV